MNKALDNGFEQVLTIADFMDTPRQGVANFGGRPHSYDCVFDMKKDEYTNMYKLIPLDSATAELAVEDWQIFLRWRAAFDSRETDLSTHPTLPQDASRHAALTLMLKDELHKRRKLAFNVKGEFKRSSQVPPKDLILDSWSVKWL